jgi:hypothetical protein
MQHFLQTVAFCRFVSENAENATDLRECGCKKIKKIFEIGG